MNPVSAIDGIDTRVDVDIAIIDTGIDLSHLDLNVYTNISFSADSPTGTDGYGHGTEVSGACAALDNSFGTVGIAPGARLWAVRVLDVNGDGLVSQVISGIDWVVGHASEVEIINMSLTYSPGVGEGDPVAMRSAIQAAVAAGIVVVVAAGNAGQDVYGNDLTLGTLDDFLPAAWPEVMAVSSIGDFDGVAGGLSATDSFGHDDTLASYSNFSSVAPLVKYVTSPGGAIDVAAPGTGVYTTANGGGYISVSGTSLASPIAAGAVGLYISTYGRAYNSSGVYAIRQAIVNGAEPQVAWGAWPPNPNPSDMQPEGLVDTRSFLPPVFSGGQTYYVDFSAGNDASNGLSTGTAWKKCPGMAGFGGDYTHLAGDRFMFKGGVTWPVGCFPMVITESGLNDSVRDYYGTATNWFTGAAWSRALFDFENTQLSPSGWAAGAGVHVLGSNITFSAMEMARHRAPLTTGGSSSYGCVTLLFDGTPSNITVTNCLIRDWSIPSPVPAGTDGGGGGGVCYINAGAGGGTGFVVTHSEFHQVNSAVKSGVSCNFYGIHDHNEYHHTPNGVIGGGTVQYNYFHNITDGTDPNLHPNATEFFAPSTNHHNLMHTLSANAAAIYHIPDWSGGNNVDLIYDNVVYDCGFQAAVQIDTGGAHTSTIGARIYNNTLVHSGMTIRVVERGTGPYGTLDVRNNLLITSGLPVAYNNPGAGYANVTAYTFSSNVVYTATVAAGFGFTASNNYAPTLSFGAYRSSAIDFSALYTTDYLDVTRTVPWDIGAYEFVSLVPPPSVRIAVNDLRAGIIITKSP